MTSRTDLAESQNWRCAYCGIEMHEDWRRPDGATRDHLTPKSLGGEDGRTNLVAACRTCNEARGAEMPPVKFYRWVKQHRRLQARRPVAPLRIWCQARLNEMLMKVWIKRSLARRRRFQDMAMGRAKVLIVSGGGSRLQFRPYCTVGRFRVR